MSHRRLDEVDVSCWEVAGAPTGGLGLGVLHTRRCIVGQPGSGTYGGANLGGC